MTSVAITGCRGFIGSALTASMEKRGFSVVPVGRQLLAAERRTELARAIENSSAVIHCAGLTPRRGQRLTEADFDLANHQFTKNLAAAAAAASVPRLVFVSSIAVIGSRTGMLTPTMPPHPSTAYGRSKANAERALLSISDIQSIILRPPLVYGPGAKGDLGMLVRLCASPLPLPFGSVENRRSMVAITNLVDALCFLAATDAVGSGSQIHHVSDADPMSLRQIVSTLRAGLGRPANLMRVSPSLLALLLRGLGLGSVAEKLLGDLLVDSSSLAATGWRPPVGPESDLKDMAHAHLAGRSD
ncbi:NAD-dependent epimerase/dehydratase family protein [Arvimicrobium flavum]|uniref:NAD-dependent epimerase/dehydratase family protein n=1 Tax=Arvimicrobium flavum TaxID=3393320 RepID=UPI00237B45CE|nr:NAD-dependent epimerase/dehydratase family protein [Mesorhizobium shangrilense]